MGASHTLHRPLCRGLAVIRRKFVAAGASGREDGEEEKDKPVYDKIFEQYQLVVEDTARLTDRRQTINNIYLSANSLLLGGIAVLAQTSGIKNVADILLIFLLVCAGTVLCIDWSRLIESYRKLLALRFELLKKIESRPDFPAPVHIYTEEEVLYPSDPGQRRFGFTKVEVNLPLVFITLYVLVVIGSIVIEYSVIASQLADWGLILPGAR
jgi:hypothetical protein